MDHASTSLSITVVSRAACPESRWLSGSKGRRVFFNQSRLANTSPRPKQHWIFYANLQKNFLQMQHNSINLLVERLSKLDVNLVLLFGSFATGTKTDDSDIDLLVVTNDMHIPKNYDERIELQLAISNHIVDIAKQIPVDLIVYTLPMYQKFIAQNSSFAREIKSKGIVLYERNNKGMA